MKPFIITFEYDDNVAPSHRPMHTVTKQGTKTVYAEDAKAACKRFKGMMGSFARPVEVHDVWGAIWDEVGTSGCRW